MNHLATPHSAPSFAEAELTAAIDPEATVPDPIAPRPLALLVVANRIVAVFPAPPSLDFDADKWWAR